MSNVSRDRYDAIVVGLGVNGSAATYELARRGQRVLALEQFSLDHIRGSSHGDSRIIRYAYDYAIYIDMVMRAFPLWYEFQDLVGETLIQRTGMFEFGSPDNPGYVATKQTMTSKNIPFDVLSPADVQTRFPQFRIEPDEEAMFQADGAYLAASKCVAAFIRLAGQHGAVIRENTPVTKIEPLADGVRVYTNGEQFEAGRLIIAAGSWAAGMLASVGVHVPLVPLRQHLVYIQAPQPDRYKPEQFPVFLQHDDTSFYGLPDVGYGLKVAIHKYPEVADPEEIGITTTEHYLDQTRAFLTKHMPNALGSIRETKTCLYTMTPDEHFILDKHPEYSQIIIASACSGHGFKFGILVGKILADLATIGSTDTDLSMFKVDRF